MLIIFFNFFNGFEVCIKFCHIAFLTIFLKVLGLFANFEAKTLAGNVPKKDKNYKRDTISGPALYQGRLIVAMLIT
jgi:hypothetical protein